MGLAVDASEGVGQTDFNKFPLKKKWLILLVSFLAIATVIRLLRQRGEPEPTYKGLPISRWIELNPIPSSLEKGLAEIGPESIPYLRRALRKTENPFRSASVWLWRKLPRSTQAKYFASYAPIDARSIRGAALWGFRFWGPEAREALPDLVTAAGREGDLFNRAIIMHALTEVGGSSPEVLKIIHQRLKSTDKIARDQAAAAIFDSRINDVAAVPLLIESMKRSPTNAFNEFLALGAIGPPAEPTLPFIIEALDTQTTRGNALTALRGVGAVAAPAVPTLISLVEGGQQKLNPTVIEILMNVGPPASNSVSLLESALESEDAVGRAMAAVALGRIKGNPESAIPVLLAELRNKRFAKEEGWVVWLPNAHLIGFNHRQTAAWFLGEIGPPATNAVPELKNAMQDKERWLRILAARATWRIAGPNDQILPVLSQSLSSMDNITSALAAQALTEMGAAARTAVPALLNARTNSLYVRRAVNEALKRIDPETAAKAIYQAPR
jgi:HEAT repeat protein